MTLGGLALAVGVLVDDATVELENTHRNFGADKPIRQAILDSASQIATPAIVSTLAICIVFVPVLFLTGPAASLFYPLALAVVFAILTSYLLSRTLVPTMMLYMLPVEVPLYTDPEARDNGRRTRSGSFIDASIASSSASAWPMRACSPLRSIARFSRSC